MLHAPNRDERQAFVFSGTIRHETERGLLIVPRGLREPLWFQRRLTRVLGCDQFAVPNGSPGRRASPRRRWPRAAKYASRQHEKQKVGEHGSHRLADFQIGFRSNRTS